MVTDIREWRRGEFLVSTDRTRLDLDAIHQFLTNCYWAKGISKELVTRSIEHSLCFGIYDESGSEYPGLAKPAKPGAPPARVGAPLGRPAIRQGCQVGFGRAISDFATFAYVGDVFVLETHRGRGLSKFMMQCIMKHPVLQGLRRWILLTRDAHRLYEQFGFTPLQSAERYMDRPDVYDIGETK